MAEEETVTVPLHLFENLLSLAWCAAGEGATSSEALERAQRIVERLNPHYHELMKQERMARDKAMRAEREAMKNFYRENRGKKLWYMITPGGLRQVVELLDKKGMNFRVRGTDKIFDPDSKSSDLLRMRKLRPGETREISWKQFQPFDAFTIHAPPRPADVGGYVPGRGVGRGGSLLP